MAELTVTEVKRQALEIREKNNSFEKNVNEVIKVLQHLSSTVKSEDSDLSVSLNQLANTYQTIYQNYFFVNFTELAQSMDEWAQKTEANEQQAIQDVNSVTNANQSVIDDLDALISKSGF